MLRINNRISIKKNELEINSVRAQGPGGQNVNKTSSAVHLRFDIKSSTLPVFIKEKLLRINDQRITKQGVIIIKSQEYRSQSINKQIACQRLIDIIRMAIKNDKKRITTKPTTSSVARRIQVKKHRGKLKILRNKVKFMDH